MMQYTIVTEIVTCRQDFCFVTVFSGSLHTITGQGPLQKRNRDHKYVTMHCRIA